MEYPNCAYSGGDNEPHLAEKYSSGTPICWAHWYWLKLDLPAAQHWSKVAAAFLSNFDMWDYQNFMPAAGLEPTEIETMLVAARKVLDHSNAVLAGLAVAPKSAV